MQNAPFLGDSTEYLKASDLETGKQNAPFLGDSTEYLKASDLETGKALLRKE